jgi:hypothetical protein
VSLQTRKRRGGLGRQLPGVLVLPAGLVGYIWAKPRGKGWGREEQLYAQRQLSIKAIWVGPEQQEGPSSVRVDIRAHGGLQLGLLEYQLGAELDVLANTPAVDRPPLQRRVRELHDFIARLRLLEPESPAIEDCPFRGCPLPDRRDLP